MKSRSTTGGFRSWMTSYGTVHPLDMVYDMAHVSLSFDKQVPQPLEPPIYWSSPILVYPPFPPYSCSGISDR